VWWLAGRALPRRPSGYERDGQAALRRHPAGRDRRVEPDGLRPPGRTDGPGLVKPAGPDDDPEFISALERLIRGDDHGESA
jgi:hypothetical protein